MAAVDLGFILIELNEENAARAAFETAIHSGHPVAAPRAAAALGMILLVSDHDKASAKRAFGVAAVADDPDVAARARLELGKLKEQAEPDEAISDYRALEECGVQDVSEEALLRLGVVFSDVRRNLPAAEEAFRKAMQSDDPLRKSKAAMALGRLLLERRDWAGAREALQFAVDAPEPRTAGFALVFLGDALAMLGQPDEAWRAYFRASRSANPRVSQLADDRIDRRAWQRGGR
jgi:tetratricopeptide (TPR) repeat protein